MLETGGESAGAARKRQDIDRRVTVLVRPITELARDVVPPTLDSARARESARVEAANGDGGNLASQPEYVDRRAALFIRPVAELPMAVVTPST